MKYKLDDQIKNSLKSIKFQQQKEARLVVLYNNEITGSDNKYGVINKGL